MTTETNLDPNAVETSGYGATPVETPPPADDTANEPNPETNDELELTEGDELVEGEEEAGEDKKVRHKSAKERIAQLTREKHEERRRNEELEQRLAALEGRAAPKTEPSTEFVFDEPEPDPNDDKYEFGEADAQYLKDIARYEGRKAYAEERHKADQQSAVESQQAEARQTLVNLDEGWAEAEKRGATKYADFSEKVEDFKANAPCPPLMAVAIQASPVAEDVTYHLATNQDQAELIAARLSGGDVLGAARQLGEIEGQFLDKKPDRPAANAHAADHALYAGRLKGFLNRKEKPKAKIATDAPDPPKERARGGNGQFSPDWASDDADLGALAKQLR